MGRYSVREAVTEDFEEVYPLLLKLNAPKVTPEAWRRLFATPWPSRHGHCGYVVTDGRRIRGFLGALFSERPVNGVTVPFCNMTSWIVEPEARSASVAMLVEMLKLRDHTITNFTPSDTVARLLTAMRFSEIMRTQRVVFAAPTIGAKPGISVMTDVGAIRNRIRPADRTILDDHNGFDCLHSLIDSGREYSYLVLKRLVRRRLPLLRPHYVSNPSLFRATLGRVRARLCLPAMAAGLLVDEKYLNGVEISFSTPVSADARWFVRSEAVIPSEIDTIYSELVLLHA